MPTTVTDPKTGLTFTSEETTPEQLELIEARTRQLSQKYGPGGFEDQALQLRYDELRAQREMQQMSLNLQAKIRSGELSLQKAMGQLDRTYKEQVLRQNERQLQSAALAKAQEQELAAAPYRLPRGNTSFPGFEAGGLAAQLAQQYGFNFTPPPVQPIEFNPRQDVKNLFAGSMAGINLPDPFANVNFDVGVGGIDQGWNRATSQLPGRERIGGLRMTDFPGSSVPPPSPQQQDFGVSAEELLYRQQLADKERERQEQRFGVSAEELQYRQQLENEERERQRQMLFDYGVDLR